MPAKASKPIIWSNPAFKLLILIVTTAMFTGFAVQVVLAFAASEPPTAQQAKLGETCSYIVTFTLPAIVGLLCGRAGAADNSQG